MASKNSERDKYGVFSESLMVNRWVWVVLDDNKDNLDPKSEKFKSEARVMSLLNTNTSYWLIKNKFNAVSPAPDIRSLVKALDNKEVDAIFVAEVVFIHRSESTKQYQVILEKEKEFGMYVSNDFIEKTRCLCLS
ncbi:hypothetical protein KP803_10335 [Vibrio sp. ZSDE26]|uniref:Solute-binding protein family 3/N-terminal domain-containing protein n=1 Tax=Vibrio amylolyticus TaxID=2847292 RepID=A0A9X1XK78_9VIBR|nr:hypothetical protein [Vibrio amylolyticus]MCK6263670.1 hypothetical protein [Vibrio amylolyticus]